MWGQIAQAGAQVFSSLAPSIFGDEGPGFMEQRNHNATMMRDQSYNNNYLALKHRMNAANDFGLHPLTALGAQPVGSATASITSPTRNSPDFEAMGQGIDRALNYGRTQVQRELDDLALEKAKLSNDYLKVQIAGARQSIANHAPITSLPHPSDGNTVPSSFSPRLSRSGSDGVDRIKSDAVAHVSGDRSLEAGSSPMWKRFYIDNDRYINLPPNQSVDELGLPMSFIKSGELAYKTYAPKRVYMKRPFKSYSDWLARKFRVNQGYK